MCVRLAEWPEWPGHAPFRWAATWFCLHRDVTGTCNMAATEENVDEFPTELQDRLSGFDDSLGAIEDILKPLHDVPLSQVHVNVSV